MIADEVRAVTGCELTIGGTLDLRLFTINPAVVMGDVSLANAPWGTRPEMIRLRRAEAQVALWPLLKGKLRIKKIVLISPDILLETDAKGRGKWLFLPHKPLQNKKKNGKASTEEGAGDETGNRMGDRANADAPPLLAVDESLIERGILVFRNGQTKKRFKLSLRRLTRRAPDTESPISLDIEGAYNGAPFRLESVLGSLITLGRKDTAFLIELKIRAGGAEIWAKGRMAEPLAGRGVAISVSMAGMDSKDFGAFLGTELPSMGPYRLTAAIADRRGTWRLSRVRAKIGKSAFDGRITISSWPLKVDAALTASMIDLEDFGLAAR